MQFLILSILFVVIERLWPWRREQQLRRGGILTDLFHWLFNGYIFYLGYSIITGYTFGLFTDAVRSTGFGAFLDIRLLTGLPLVVQFIILFLVQDFLMWGTHNLLHRVPVLWEIHKVHHSIETMDWIGNMRYHYGEIIVYNLTMFLPLLVLGADTSLFIYLNIFNTFIGHFNHANVRVDLGPLRYLFNSPRMHIWHHDRSGPGSKNKNFAIGLSIWDWIFGTAYYPKPGEADQPESLGFDGLEEFPKTFVGQQLHPISRTWRRNAKLFLALALLGTATATADAGGITGKEIRIDTVARSVSFGGTFHPEQYRSQSVSPANHHFIVWRNGRASGKALIVADADDRDILAALISLGATAGNNLSADAWTHRNDPTSSAPDVHVAGSRIDVTVSWKGENSVHAADLFDDPAGHGFEFRFGGHESLIPLWRSGCIVCLESCPGGRVSNAGYTMRDLEKGTARFPLRDHLPPKGRRVVVTLTVME